MVASITALMSTLELTKALVKIGLFVVWLALLAILMPMRGCCDLNGATMLWWT